ncbi:MAG: response regulator [Flavobacteriales bacterium]
MSAVFDVACVVDDDRIFVFGISRLMEMTNFCNDLVVCEHGKEALDYLISADGEEQKLPDIILLDINMPVLDGWQFLDEFIKIKPRLDKEITIYMVSSSVSKTDIERAKSYDDICDYIIKPVKSEDLQMIIKHYEESRLN